MKKLGDRNFTLINRGAGIYGTLDPDVILFTFEEDLYIHEAEEVIEFLKWCFKHDKKFGWGNYEDVFKEFKESKRYMKARKAKRYNPEQEYFNRMTPAAKQRRARIAGQKDFGGCDENYR